MGKKFRIAITSLAILIGIASLAYLWFRPSTKFDGARWNDKNLPASVRLQMADDLIRTHRLDGMTRGQVVVLLGEPPKTPYFKDYELVYLLGPERGAMRIDSEWLVVKFGRDGCAEARIARD